MPLTNYLKDNADGLDVQNLYCKKNYINFQYPSRLSNSELGKVFLALPDVPDKTAANIFTSFKSFKAVSVKPSTYSKKSVIRFLQFFSIVLKTRIVSKAINHIFFIPKYFFHYDFDHLLKIK